MPCAPARWAAVSTRLHRFVNYRHAAIRAALDACLAMLRQIKPAIHLLLTVSPVPLTATASGQHVHGGHNLFKSVLRAVAGRDDRRSRSGRLLPVL